MEDARMMILLSLKRELDDKKNLGMKNPLGNWIFPRCRRARIKRMEAIMKGMSPEVVEGLRIRD